MIKPRPDVCSCKVSLPSGNLLSSEVDKTFVASQEQTQKGVKVIALSPDSQGTRTYSGSPQSTFSSPCVLTASRRKTHTHAHKTTLTIWKQASRRPGAEPGLLTPKSVFSLRLNDSLLVNVAKFSFTHLLPPFSCLSSTASGFSFYSRETQS